MVNMSNMKISNVINMLEKSGKRVFSIYDAAKVMGKPTAYASLMLSKSEYVERIERGKYFIKGTSIYEIASNITFPSYVSLYAAMQYYELIDQNIIKYSVISLKRHKPVVFENGVSIEFVNVKRRMMFGYERRDNTYIASPDKLFIDCLYTGRVPFSQLKDALISAKDEGLVNPELIVRYGLMSGSPTLINRLGFLLESAGVDFDEEKLLKLRYHNYVEISGTGLTGKSKKWLVAYDR
jgi:predicted transcriptional regulator of viral defense system